MSKHSRARAAAKSAGGISPSLEPGSCVVRGGTFLAGGIVVLAALAVYHNGFSGPFVFDDGLAVTDNPTIKQLGSALFPPPGTSVGCRPVLNLTFALNYALGGTRVWGYHAFNLLVHILAGLTLFGLVRRTLCMPSQRQTQCPGQSRGDGARCPQRASQPAVDGLVESAPQNALRATRSTPVKTSLLGQSGHETILALAIAVLWVVHPLQTEAVTYISQRAESLMGLFYLLTLYCFVRGVENNRQQPKTLTLNAERRTPNCESPTTNYQIPTAQYAQLWLIASVFSCLLGTLTKEIIVTVPAMVLLYDRTFVAGSFREAWRRRWRYYLGLAGTWLLLARSLIGLSQRNVGFNHGVTGWIYALTSCRSVVRYLKLAVWPHPLVFDYGTGVVHGANEALPYVLVLAVLAAGVVIALRRRPAVGFLGAWFFVILAPASSVIPVADQPMAENRMYLSLAAVIVLVLSVLYQFLGRRSLVVFAAVAVGLGCLTVRRNEDYYSALAIWSDTSAKQPDNARAHNNLGLALADLPGRLAEAISEYETALRINPNFAEAHSNLGEALARMPGRLTEAMAHYEKALRIKPGYAEAHNNLGEALARMPGRLTEAIAHFETALRIKPDFAQAHSNLGMALATIPGRLPEAIAHHEAALRLRPDSAIAHNNLGVTLAKSPGRLSEAISQYEAALRINPDYAEAHYNLGLALLQNRGLVPEAAAQFEAALSSKPDLEPARQKLNELRTGKN